MRPRPPARFRPKPRAHTRLRVGQLEDRSLPAAFLWVAGSGGFADQANWRDQAGNMGVPQAGDEALILTPGVTVTSDADATVRSLTSKANLQVTAGTLAAGAANLLGPVAVAGGNLLLGRGGTADALTLSAGSVGGFGLLTVTGDMDWTGGTVSGGLRVAAGATLDIGGAGPKVLDTTTLTNDGTATWDGAGGLELRHNSAFRNLGLFRDLADHAVTFVGSAGETATFYNSGTFVKAGGAGVTDLGVLVDTPGTVRAETGTVRLTGGLQQYDGVFTTLRPSTWYVAGGATIDIDEFVITSQADITLAGPGATFARLTHLDRNSGSLTLTGGASLTNTAVSLRNQGRLTLGPGSTLTVPGFTQVGTARLTVQVAGGQSGKLVSTASATLDGTLALQPGADTQTNDAYDVLTGSSVTGRFSAVVQDGFGATPVFGAAVGGTAVTVTAGENVTNLAVTAVGPPAGPVDPGEEVTITWTVKNATAGAATTVGAWMDAVYVSATPTFDDSAVLVARVPHTGDLPAADTYDGEYIGPLPGLLPGTYYVHVRADVDAVVPDPDRTDNSAAGATFMVADPPVLPIGGAPVDGTVPAGGDAWLRVDAPGGSPLRLTATFGAAGAGEVSVDYRQVPGLGSALATSADPAAATQTVILQATQAGTHYVRVHGAAAGGGAFQIRADAPTFEVTRLVNASGSRLGTATLTVHGVGFTPNTKVTLARGTTTRAATKVLYAGPDTVYATFNLVGLTAGAYDVKVSDGLRNPPPLVGAYTVTNDAVGFLEFTIPSVPVMAIGEETVAAIEFENTGGTDLPAPFLVIDTLVSSASFRLPEQPAGEADTRQYFLLTSTDAPAGVVPAGYHGRLEVVVTQRTASQVVLRLEEVNAGKPITWNSFKGYFKPLAVKNVGVTDDPWDGVWANFLAAVGTSSTTYMTALRDAATYLAAVGTPVRNVSGLLGYLFQQADAAYPGGAPWSATDAIVPTAGLALDFTRTAARTVRERYRNGRLGRGWADNWDISVANAFGTPPTTGNSDLFVRVGATDRAFVRGAAANTYVPRSGGDEVLAFDGTRFVLTDDHGEVTAFRPDGLLDYVQAPDGSRVTASYDMFGRLLALTNTAGRSLSFTWNAAGQLASVKDPDGRETRFAYSGGRLASATGPAGVERYTYVGSPAGAAHALASVTPPGGPPTTFAYDPRGRLTRRAAGGVEAITYTYGPGGGITATDAAKGTVYLQPDAVGRITAVWDSAGSGLRVGYDADGQTARLETAAGQVWTYDRDAEGRVVGITDPLGNTVRYGYQGDDLASVSDARGKITTIEADPLGRIVGITDPGGGTEGFVYDPDGHLVEKTNRRGDPVRYLTDAVGRVVSRVLSDGSHTDYTYDAHGNLKTATDAAGVTALEYDSADRLKKVTYPGGKFLQFTYDAAGRRLTSTDRDGFKLAYVYDAAGRLSAVRDGKGATVVRYTYDPAGRVARKDQGNGTYATYKYDPSGRLLTLENHGKGTAVHSRFDYTYDAAGRVATMTTGGEVTTYGYDLTGQLTSVTVGPVGGAATRTITYAYDPAGNRTGVTDNGVTTTYTVDERNRVTGTEVGGLVTEYAYDADGNRLTMTDGAGTTNYAWDDLSRLTGVDAPGTANDFAYTYDVFDNLFTTAHGGQTTTNLTDPLGSGNLMAQYNAGVPVARYVHGLGLEARQAADGTRAYYQFDRLGDVVGLTNAAGAVVNKYSYLPFGETTATPLAGAVTDNPFTFVGRWGVTTDGNGLVSMRARSYDPKLGGFVSDDPIGFAGGDSNVRRYVGNDPVNGIDPTGLKCTDDQVKKLQQEIDRVSKELAIAQKTFDHYNSLPNNGKSEKAIPAEAFQAAHDRPLGEWRSPLVIYADFYNGLKEVIANDGRKLADLKKQLEDCKKELEKAKRHPDMKFSSGTAKVPGTTPVKRKP